MSISLYLVGIGTGNPEHVTNQATRHLKKSDIIMLPRKGSAKNELADLRYQICEKLLGKASPPIFEFDLPTRDCKKSYIVGVTEWHNTIANIWQETINLARSSLGRPLTRVGLLIWGDPSLYDSSTRIAEQLNPRPHIRIIPGITSLQALAAAHSIPLNDLAAPFLVTTGRRLSESGFPRDVDTVAVMLDGNCAFSQLKGTNFNIWWGAYLGMPSELILSGRLDEVSNTIIETRSAARKEHGWIMDTYLLKRNKKAEH